MQPFVPFKDNLRSVFHVPLVSKTKSFGFSSVKICIDNMALGTLSKCNARLF